jgi:hypothetical protein
VSYNAYGNIYLSLTFDGVREITKRIDGAGLVPRRSEAKDEADLRRYRFLRNADIDAIHNGGIFAGKTPENIILTGADLDSEIDIAMDIPTAEE